MTFLSIKSSDSKLVQRDTHPTSHHRLSLFTDDSETHYSAILTQVPDGQLKRDIEEQEYEPLPFLSVHLTARHLVGVFPKRMVS